MRKEKDSLGFVEVPDERLYGAQTERSRKNFPIGTERMPDEVIDALLVVKKAAAIVNAAVLGKQKSSRIIAACDALIKKRNDADFPLVVWQTGSGTQSNMNVNEVIAHMADVHPNDDVNMSQSSNDTFPTAMHIAGANETKKLLISLSELIFAFQNLNLGGVIKVGRTHLMDATPLKFEQEFSGYIAQLEGAKEEVEHALKGLYELALGGTAVGTGINAPKGFDENVAIEIARLTGEPFVTAPNKFAALAAHDALISMSSALKRLACALMKIANDIRLMGSGPRCGLGELKLPENEPGSSIMPGKVNPTQCEALTMVAVQVMGNDMAVAIAGSQGNFELNVYKPVMIYNLLQSLRLLTDGMASFRERCVEGIKVNEPQVTAHLENSLMLATALNREIGYDAASKIVRKAHQEGITLKEAALALEILDEACFDSVVDPRRMV